MRCRLLFAILPACCVASPAIAAMTAQQTVEKEVAVRAPDGAESLIRQTADKVTPGETIIYSIRYENDSSEAASGIVLVMPVPEEVDYIEGSVAGGKSGVTFSADGGKTYVARGRLTVEENGATRPARGDEITHIRWELSAPVPPGGKGEVSYKAVLR